MTARTLRRVGCGLLLVAAGFLAAPPATPPASAADRPGTTTPAPAEVPKPTEQLLAELRRRNDELEARERDLARRERSLVEFAAEAENTLAELDARHTQIETRIAALENLTGDGTARLAKLYAAMPPERAAVLLERLDIELASFLLAQMKPKTSASVLALMDPARALVLSEHTALPLGTPDRVVRDGSGPPAAPAANGEGGRYR